MHLTKQLEQVNLHMAEAGNHLEGAVNNLDTLVDELALFQKAVDNEETHIVANEIANWPLDRFAEILDIVNAIKLFSEMAENELGKANDYLEGNK